MHGFNSSPTFSSGLHLVLKETDLNEYRISFKNCAKLAYMCYLNQL